MKIQTINIKNFKGIESFKGNLNGKNVYLIGSNGSGKTSFIDAVWCGLTGKNLPPEPTTNGAKNGIIELDLGDFIARTKFKKNKPAVFEIENKNVSKDSEKFIKAPRSFMEDKIGILNFDINEFFSKSDSEQLKYFAKIMNEDFSDIDSEIEENIESRKFDKRELKTLTDTLDYFDPKDADKQIIDVVSLSKKIAIENKKIESFSKVQDGIDQRLKRAEELEKEIKLIKSEIKDGYSWLEDESNIPLDLNEIKDLEISLENSTSINAKITSAKAAKIQESNIEQLEKNIDKINKDIDILKAKKAERISKLINVDGLTYCTNEERFLYNGLPFAKNQINTAAQLIAGMKIGASTLKELKILKVDASLIDKNNFDEVLTWAESEGIELFIELVDRDGSKLAIVLDAEN